MDDVIDALTRFGLFDAADVVASSTLDDEEDVSLSMRSDLIPDTGNPRFLSMSFNSTTVMELYSFDVVLLLLRF